LLVSSSSFFLRVSDLGSATASSLIFLVCIFCALWCTYPGL
jgi:hypothetical protein